VIPALTASIFSLFLCRRAEQTGRTACIDASHAEHEGKREKADQDDRHVAQEAAHGLGWAEVLAHPVAATAMEHSVALVQEVFAAVGTGHEHALCDPTT
jgi:hypothetical protein